MSSTELNPKILTNHTSGTGTANANAIQVDGDYVNPTFYASGWGTATVAIQFSPDGTNWQSHTTTITANGALALGMRISHGGWVRANVTAFTSGTLNVHFLGRKLKSY